MAKEKTSEKKDKKLALRFTIFFIIVAILAATYFFVDKIENFVNFYYNDNALPTQIDNSGLKVHFIDVDQADGIMIEFPTGEKMLIDAGDTETASEEKLLNYLNKLEYKTENNEKIIDYFLITHPHDDHIGAGEQIFETYKIETFIRPNVKSSDEVAENEYDSSVATSTNKTYNNIINLSEAEGCTTITSSKHLEIKNDNYNASSLNKDKFTWKITFLSPSAEDLPYKTGSLYEMNDYSPIMILEYMNKKIMLTGDAEKQVEKDVLEDYTTSTFLDVDILKAGHHGSKTSSSKDFLDKVKPEYVVVSAGKDNQFNHPDEETLERFKAAGLTDNDIYCTAENGTILVGISTTGELCLISDYVQYTTFKIEWWYLFTTGTVIAAVIIFVPLLSKKNQKKVKNSLKSKKSK